MTNTMTQDSRQNPQTIVNRVTSIGIIGNVILSLFKFLAGIFGHSSAMVSDAIHSLSDVLATFIAWLGIRLSMQAPDREHPYGHERLECVASLLLGTILFGTGLMIGLSGLKTILAAVDKVKSGISICIFPEGTRNKNEDDLDMLPFHEGSFKIATKAKCPIIPIAINNSADIFEAHFPKIHPAKVVVEYGKPIYPDELDKETKKHLGEYTQGIIHQILEKNKPLTQ